MFKTFDAKLNINQNMKLFISQDLKRGIQKRENKGIEKKVCKLKNRFVKMKKSASSLAFVLSGSFT